MSLQHTLTGFYVYPCHYEVYTHLKIRSSFVVASYQVLALSLSLFLSHTHSKLHPQRDSPSHSPAWGKKMRWQVKDKTRKKAALQLMVCWMGQHVCTHRAKAMGHKEQQGLLGAHATLLRDAVSLAATACLLSGHPPMPYPNHSGADRHYCVWDALEIVHYSRMKNSQNWRSLESTKRKTEKKSKPLHRK